MFDRFSDDARQVMRLAREEALRWNHEYIDPRHILLGVLRVEHGGATNLLQRLDVDCATLRSEVRRSMTAGANTVALRQIPFTPRAKDVLEHSFLEISSHGEGVFGSEHLLLGLAHDPTTGPLLVAAGVSMDRVRADLGWDSAQSRPAESSSESKCVPTGGSMQAIDSRRGLGLRLSMRAGALYDALLAIAMLTALPLLSRVLAIPMPPDPLFVRFNALLLFGVALFYALGAAAPGAACLRFAAGTIAFRASGGLFVAAQVPLAHAPAAFLLVGTADLAFAAWTWAELRFRVRARFWPLLLAGDVRELERDVVDP